MNAVVLNVETIASALLGLLGVIGLALAWQAAGVKRSLRRERDLARATLHSIGDGVITADAAGRIEYLNPVAEQYTGWRLDEARGRALDEVFQLVDERSGGKVAVQERRGGKDEADITAVRLVDRRGGKCPVRYSRAPIRSSSTDGDAGGFIVVFHDISQLRAMARQLIWQASHDALTGLVNRREFERRLANLIDTGKSLGREHAMLFMDLDGFKVVNDSCGHAAGDELLRQVTQVMGEHVRGSDTLARLGGDEFGALLEACPVDQALRIANGIREAVREYRFVWDNRSFGVGVSIGLVPITAASGDVTRALSLADACCYEAKSRGRDRVQVARSDATADAPAAGSQAIADINRALERNEFQLFRQPIVPLIAAPPRSAPRYEVLVRMIGADGEPVPATGFVPAAERYNLLTAIERWVIMTLVRYLHAQWADHAAGRGPDPGAYSVNLSGASINDKSFPDFIRGLFARHPLPVGALCFEITETTAITNLTQAALLIRELKAMGCTFALDDFGTGMSSFAYLKSLPVDYLKIADVFIRDVATDAMSAAIVEGINRISHLLGMQTIAESVENGFTLSRLEELGVDYAQGFFIAQPEGFARPREELAVAERLAG